MYSSKTRIDNTERFGAYKEDTVWGVHRGTKVNLAKITGTNGLVYWLVETPVSFDNF